MNKHITFLLIALVFGPNCFSQFSDNFEHRDLSKWTIGGRRQGNNIAEVVERGGSFKAHLRHEDFTEITLEKDFLYTDDLTFSFEMETNVESTASGTSDFYASAGVSFYFYDQINNHIGTVAYISVTSTYPISTSSTNPTAKVNPISEGKVQNYNFSLPYLLSQITPSGPVHRVKIRFYGYTSGWPYNMAGEVWVDNVKISKDEYIDPMNGLLAYLPFNGNTEDVSGNNYNFSVSGPILTQDRFGNENSAYDFDGDQDYLQADNKLPINGFPVSISAWIYPEEFSGDGLSYIYSSDDWDHYWGSYRGFSLDLRSDGNLSANYGNGVNTSSNYFRTNSSPVVLNKWHHIVAIFNGPGDIEIYVNGEAENVIESTPGNDVVSFSAAKDRIGYAYDGLNRHSFNGAIDDIRIFNRSINKKEVEEFYTEENWETETLTVRYRLKSYSSGSYISGAKAVFSYSNTGVFLKTYTRYSDSDGYVTFDIPSNSNFTLIIKAEGFSDQIYSKLHIMESEENIIYLYDDGRTAVFSPWIIRPLMENASSTASGVCTEFDLSSGSSNIYDFNNFVSSHYNSSMFDIYLMTIDTDDDEIVGAQVVNSSDNLKVDLCNLATGLLDLAGAYLGIGTMGMIPICNGIEREPEVVMVNGREYLVEDEYPILFGLINVKTYNPYSIYISGPIKKATGFTPSMKVVDEYERITGSVFNEGVWVEDRFEIPDVFYSGYNSNPTVLLMPDSLSMDVTVNHTGLTELQVTERKFIDTVWVSSTYPLNFQTPDSTNLNLLLFSSANYPVAIAKVYFDTVASNQNQTLDASSSHGMDSINFTYEWYEGSELLGEGVFFSMIFPVGKHNIILKATSDLGFSSYSYISFVVNSEVIGIDRNDSGDFRVYPNPVSDILFIEDPGFTKRVLPITMYDLFGRQILSIQEKGGKTALNVDHIRNGVYLLKIGDEQIYKVLKVE